MKKDFERQSARSLSAVLLVKTRELLEPKDPKCDIRLEALTDRLLCDTK
ncbi:MAG TPA: hypothetical protein VID19_03860 [Candidatus Eremiobacteraceae bacterium]